MKDWKEVEQEIQQLDFTHRGILECRGTARRKCRSC
jgi:hypothetical protein